VTTGTTAHDTQPVRVDTEPLGVHPNVPDGTADVGHGVRHLEPGRTAVMDGENRESRIEQVAELTLTTLGRRPGGEPASADHEQHTRAIGVRGLEDVVDKRHSVLVAVDDVGRDGHLRRGRYRD